MVIERRCRMKKEINVNELNKIIAKHFKKKSGGER